MCHTIPTPAKPDPRHPHHRPDRRLLLRLHLLVTLGTARLDDAEYIATMQAINATVRNPIFAFSFFGAVLSLVLTTVVHLRHGWSPRAGLLLLALVTYALGGFTLTFGISVPLNEDLAQVSLTSTPEALAQAREDYEGAWNLWNAIRTGFSTLAFLLLIAAPFTRAASVPVPVQQRQASGSLSFKVR